MSTSDSLVFKFLSEGADDLMKHFDKVGGGAKGMARTFSEQADHVGNSAKKIAKDSDRLMLCETDVD